MSNTNNNVENTQKNEIYNKNIDSNIQTLEEKINKMSVNTGFFDYEKDENGYYYTICNGIKLDIPRQDPEQLIDTLKFLKHSIDTYIKSGYKREKLYVANNGFMSGSSFMTNYNDIFVDNRSGLKEKIMGDTTFLSQESIEKLFGDNTNGFYSEKIANFLNQVFSND